MITEEMTPVQALDKIITYVYKDKYGARVDLSTMWDVIVAAIIPADILEEVIKRVKNGISYEHAIRDIESEKKLAEGIHVHPNPGP